MTTEQTTPIPTVLDRLFSAAESEHVYAILDGASVPDLRDRLFEHHPDHECLYRGELEPDIAEVAPYLVRLDAEADFTRWLIDEGWGAHWGIFAIGDIALDVARRHFRKFLTVHDSAGRPMLFRYYDPRVLRTYLPTCNAEELATVFGPVSSFLCEGARPGEMLAFRLSKGELVVSTPE